jgi:hypothetical protein
LILRARDKKLDIIGITEMKPKNSRYKPHLAEYSLTEVGNYKMFGKNLEKDNGRGLLLYINKEFNIWVNPLLLASTSNSLSLLLCSIDLSDGELYIMPINSLSLFICTNGFSSKFDSICTSFPFNSLFLKCLYTNADQLTNKITELILRARDKKLDIIGITEMKPKNSRCGPLTLYM